MLGNSSNHMSELSNDNKKLKEIQFLRTMLSRTGKLFSTTAVQVTRRQITIFVAVPPEVSKVFFVVFANGYHFLLNGLDLTRNIELCTNSNLIKSFCQGILLLLCKVVGNNIPGFIHKHSKFGYNYSQNTVLIGQWALPSYHQALSKRFDLRGHVLYLRLHNVRNQVGIVPYSLD
nr:hypothetical protein Iba_chr10aCG11050 [Ipomoea batatas]